jgi:RepB DNA-primase from phage plasmid
VLLTSDFCGFATVRDVISTFNPTADNRNAGYILVDLDRPGPMVLDSMRAHGHDPCVVLQTSPGHLQAWIRLSDSPLDPAFATAAGKYLAHTYGGDLASTDWRHLGRLAGFTNRKPERRTPAGYSPWVKLVHTRVGLAPRADALLQFVRLAPWEPLEPASRFPGKPTVGDLLVVHLVRIRKPQLRTVHPKVRDRPFRSSLESDLRSRGASSVRRVGSVL